MKKAQKVFYCEYGYYIGKDGKDYRYSHITTDENEAKELDENYELASIEDVRALVGAFEPIEICECCEGIFAWVELEYIHNDDEEYFGDYILMRS